MPRRLVGLVSIGVAALVWTGCATTVEDTGGDEPPEAGTFVDPSAPSTTEPIAGSAAELLPEMATAMSQLGSQIAEGGDSAATLLQIEAMWAAIRPEIESARPELVGGIQTTVDMARTAVERRRPADADKAFRLLTDLVDNFTGDG